MEFDIVLWLNLPSVFELFGGLVEHSTRGAPCFRPLAKLIRFFAVLSTLGMVSDSG